MNRYSALLLGLVAGTLTLIWLVARQPVAPAAVPPPVLRAGDTGAGAARQNPVVLPESVARPRSAPPRTGAPEPEPDAPPLPPLLADPAAASARVRLLASTFHESALAELGAYLTHEAASVRREALAALVLTGEAGAVPLLEIAAEDARQAARPEEAAALLDAAKVLSRPPPPGGDPLPSKPLSHREGKGSSTTKDAEPEARQGPAP